MKLQQAPVPRPGRGLLVFRARPLKKRGELEAGPGEWQQRLAYRRQEEGQLTGPFLSVRGATAALEALREGQAPAAE